MTKMVCPDFCESQALPTMTMMVIAPWAIFKRSVWRVENPKLAMIKFEKTPRPVVGKLVYSANKKGDGQSYLQ
jgi:hypothetical protein